MRMYQFTGYEIIVIENNLLTVLNHYNLQNIETKYINTQAHFSLKFLSTQWRVKSNYYFCVHALNKFLTSFRNVGHFCTVKFAVRFYFWSCQRPHCWVEDQHKRGNDILTSQLGLKVALVQTSHFTCAEFNVDEQKIGHHWPFTF